jgi:hypothetical protein
MATLSDNFPPEGPENLLSEVNSTDSLQPEGTWPLHLIASYVKEPGHVIY